MPEDPVSRRARLARPLIAAGFLGAYTTFSTAVVETDTLFRARDLATGTIYLISSVAAAGAAAFLGIALARLAIRLDRHLAEHLS